MKKADPRSFPPNPDELADLNIEISVLTLLERIEDSSQIEIGKHGLLIRRQSRSGLLLPPGGDRTRLGPLPVSGVDLS